MNHKRHPYAVIVRDCQDCEKEYRQEAIQLRAKQIADEETRAKGGWGCKSYPHPWCGGNNPDCERYGFEDLALSEQENYIDRARTEYEKHEIMDPTGRCVTCKLGEIAVEDRWSA